MSKKNGFNLHTEKMILKVLAAVYITIAIIFLVIASVIPTFIDTLAQSWVGVVAAIFVFFPYILVFVYTIKLLVHIILGQFESAKVSFLVVLIGIIVGFGTCVAVFQIAFGA